MAITECRLQLNCYGCSKIKIIAGTEQTLDQHPLRGGSSTIYFIK